MNEVYYKSQQAFPIEISATGFDMETDTWSVRCIVGATSTSCPKVKTDDGWVFLLDTSQLRVGVALCVVEYDVPDATFPNGLRHAVYKTNLTRILDYERM